MREIFRGFYTPKDEALKDIWNSSSTIFIYDTNCLFNLYRCEQHTREEILNLMDRLSARTWLPFQVCLEYQKNRKTVISESLTSLTTIKSSLQDLITKTEQLLATGKVKRNLYNSLSTEVDALKNKLSSPINAFIKDKIKIRIDEKIKITESDFIRKRIDEIIGDKCGVLPTQDEIDNINKEGKERYLKGIPPGFEDEKTKKERTSFFSNITFTDKFGDLYLWKEILERAKDDKVKNIIFVSDDMKPDWYFTHKGKTHGPLESLQTEIYNHADIENFKLINQSGFLYEASQYLDDVAISSASMQEVEDISLIIREKLAGYKESNVVIENNGDGDNFDRKDPTVMSWYYNNERPKEFLTTAKRRRINWTKMNSVGWQSEMFKNSKQTYFSESQSAVIHSIKQIDSLIHDTISIEHDISSKYEILDASGLAQNADAILSQLQHQRGKLELFSDYISSALAETENYEAIMDIISESFDKLHKKTQLIIESGKYLLSSIS